MRLFLARLRPTAETVILDIGGYPGFWLELTQAVGRVDTLNLHAVGFDPREHPRPSIRVLVGDGCALGFRDHSYPIVFSNSVIEHVGSWENQKKFAAEARRVGDALWIQTPAREFFLEPHYLAPFVHWLPQGMQRALVRNFTPWGWVTRPTREQVAAVVAEIRLLSHSEMRELFPDCEILEERFLGIFTKSYIAVRGPAGRSEQRGQREAPLAAR